MIMTIFSKFFLFTITRWPEYKSYHMNLVFSYFLEGEEEFVLSKAFLEHCL